MTYAELLAEVEKLVPKDAFSIGVETWRFASSEIDTHWKVTTFEGDLVAHQVSEPTAARALEKLRFELEQSKAPTGAAGVAAVVVDIKTECSDCNGTGIGPDRIDGLGDVYQDPCTACEGKGLSTPRPNPVPVAPEPNASLEVFF